MSTAEATPAKKAIPTWLLATISGAFGLLFAYAIWAAISYLVAMASADLPIGTIAWVVMSLAIVVPIAAFALAFALGRRRGVIRLLLFFLTGLAVTSVYWLDMQAYTTGTSLFS